MDYLKRTSDVGEMIEIGRRIAEEKKELYNPILMRKMMDGVENYIPDADPLEKENMVYRAIYDYWVYGANVFEEFYLHFYEKPADEKEEYLAGHLRLMYINHLNSGGGKEIRKLGLNIVTYTGYTFEKLYDDRAENHWQELLEVTDILIDGPFILEQKDWEIKFRGSSNQRYIDCRKSLAEGRVTEAEP